MELLEEGEDGALHDDVDDDESLELVFTDNNGSFASRRALEQFKGRNRQYGNAVCPECKQSFVNAARLERHLAVHQVFGAFLCPLCGKTYKYEYNLFFHWRKTCQYLNDLIGVEQRKNLDVHSLRLLVEEVVVKRSETEPVEIGISTNALFQGGSTSSQLEMPIDPQSPLARACTICGILVHKDHLPQHEVLHNATTESGLRIIDMKSPTGGYFCDLCGVAFRNRDNLFTHWRSSCPEIMASPDRNIVEEVDPTAIHRDGKHGRDGKSLSVEQYKESCPSSADPEGKALVFMDDYVDPADTLVNIDGELVNVISADRGKWNIPEDGKPLECPDCFRQFANAGRLERHISGFHSHYGAFKCLLCGHRQFANAGRLERHISGFHSHYGAFKCLLCGHRFKYDYNLLFHYRHSCAYTKLLVGADVRKLVARRCFSEEARFADQGIRSTITAWSTFLVLAFVTVVWKSSRLINVKRRPSLKAVPRNVRVNEASVPKIRSKSSLQEGKKCPVCGVLFYGQKSLDKHIGTVHLLNRAFLDKAITRENTSPISRSPVDVELNKSSSAHGGELLKMPPGRKDISGKETNEGARATEESEAPPVLEMQTPGEAVPPPTRCVDVSGKEINDFDSEQLSEIDVMLYTGQLTLGDLVITSVYGEDIEYRISRGTRHGVQIVLEKTDKASSFSQRKESERIEEHTDGQERREYSQKSKSEPDYLRNRSRNHHHEDSYQEEEENDNYTDEGEMVQYVEEEAQMEYENDDYVDYEVDDTAEPHKRERMVRFVDEEGQHLVQYMNEEGVQCEGYVQFVDDENGQHVVGLIDGEEIIDYLDGESIEGANLAELKSHVSSSSNAEGEILDEHMSNGERREEHYTVVPGSSVNNNMPEDFMQGNILEVVSFTLYFEFAFT
ncbi:zinc finger, C2H2 type [Ostertagia ostertagi]